MFEVNKEDLTIHCTRGDAGSFSVGANLEGVPYTFRAGDIVRFTVCAKKDYSSIMLRKDVEVAEETDSVQFHLDSADTKFGDVISKPTEFWYTIELNPDTYCQTIIGHTQDGARVFMQYPEADGGN
jgi:hypothetical protein